MTTKIWHIVDFHADGGQACMNGRRCFEDSEKAHKFAERMRKEPEHLCGPESVSEYTSEERLENIGLVYPKVHDSNPIIGLVPRENMVTKVLRFLRIGNS